MTTAIDPSRPATEPTLDDLRIGQRGTISRIDAGLAGHRLMEMGLVPGTTVAVVRVAPLGDPIDVSVRGYHLSLRRAEARGVFLAPASIQDATP